MREGRAAALHEGVGEGEGRPRGCRRCATADAPQLNGDGPWLSSRRGGRHPLPVPRLPRAEVPIPARTAFANSRTNGPQGRQKQECV